MDPAGFGAFQHQIKQNQAEVADYLKELESWKSEITKKDASLSGSSSGKLGKKEESLTSQSQKEKQLPPVRNSLLKKKRIRKKKAKSKPVVEENKKSTTKEKIPGFDFRAWDKYNVDEALKDVDNDESSHSSFDEETDEEWEEERMKQRATMEKENGNSFFKDGKYEEAITCYTNGIRFDPANPVLYANRAMALLKLERFGAAESDCTDALILDGTYIKAYMRRATARLKLDKKELALYDYKRIIELEPDNVFIQKESQKLEQMLHPDGVVLPVKKLEAARSKKPLVRVTIGEIDSADMQEAIAKTTQSAEKKRMEAKDNQMFEKFVKVKLDPEVGDSSLISPVNSGKKSRRDRGKSRGKAAEKKSTAPTTSFQFQKDWRSVKNDIDKAYHYFQKIPYEKYAQLFGESMEASVLTTILKIFLERYLRDGINIAEHMKHLSLVKRFSMTAMLMSNKDKEMVKQIVQRLSTFSDNDSAKIAELTQAYQVT